MKLKILFTLAIFTLIGVRVNAQDDMTPPKPVENKTLDAMIGNWAGEADMMGMKFNEEVKAYWSLNHQYVIMETKDVVKDNPNMTYGGMMILGFDKSGNVKVWWFDDWGADAMATGTGSTVENKLTMNSTNPMYTDDRTFEMKDGNLVCSWSSSMMGKDAKEMKMNGTTTYSKK